MESLLTAKDLAKILCYTEASVYNLASTHPLSLPPAIRLGRNLRWHPQTVNSWIAQKAGLSSSFDTMPESRPVQKKRGRHTKGEAAAKATPKATGGEK